MQQVSLTTELHCRNICVVKGCTSNLQTDKHLSFFNVPADRLEVWLQRINQDLLPTLNKKTRIPFKICSLHFDESMIYVNRILRNGATPVFNLPECTDVVENTGHHFTTEKVAQTDNEQYQLWEINHLRSINTQRIHETETNTVATQSTISQSHIIKQPNLAQKLSKSSSQWKVDQINPAPILLNNTKDDLQEKLFKLNNWATKIKNQFEGQHNTYQFKYFAINFYISCTPLYENLKKTHQLPNPSRLKKSKLDISFRFDSMLLMYLHQKMKLLPKKATYCTLFIDSIDIKPQLYYNITKDQIIGVHLPIQGIPEKATTAYVMMLRGIDTDWRQLVTYLLANRNSFPEIEICVNYVLRHAFSVGYQIMAIVTNQNTISYKYAREVLSVDPENPFFVLNKREIFLIYEPCDLILQLRNILLEYDLETDDGAKISWKYVKDLYSHKDKYKLNILPNFTEAHISPNEEQKKDFKYASQVFNQEVANVLELYIVMSLIPKAAVPTARFIKTICLLIDVFTSSSLTHESQYKSAFTMNKQQCSVLLYAQGLFKKLKVCDEVFNDTNKTFLCLLITIHSLLLLTNKLKAVGISHILTKRLNRHPLETIKTVINKGHDSDWKPTPFYLKDILGNMFIKQLIEDKKFYKNSNDFTILIEKGEEIATMQQTATNYVLPTSYVSSAKLTSTDLDYRFKVPNGRKKLTILSAYLFYKSSKIHRCPKFDSVWTNCSPLEWVPGLTPHLKIHLKTPPVDFYLLIYRLDEIFCLRFFTEISRPANKLLNVFKANVDPKGIICTCLPLEYIMTLFVRHRIYSVLVNNKEKSSNKIVVDRLPCNIE